MKKKHLFKIVILLVLLAACTQPGFAVINVPTQFYDDDGREIAKIINGEYTLIEDIDEALSVVQSDVVINGAYNGANHTVTGPGIGNTGKGVHINNQNGITVKSLKITGFDHGILIENSNPQGTIEPKRNTIENNEIYGCGVNAIKIFLSNATVITGNKILDNSNWGIYVEASGDGDPSYDYRNYVTGNTLTNNAGGIWLKGANYNNVESNTATGPSFAGIYLSAESGNNVLAGNTTSSNDYGIKLNDSSDNTLSGNNISGNTWGIWLDPSNSNTIEDNNITSNDNGIYIQDSSDNIVKNNTISSNDWGIQIIAYNGESSTDNQIYNNNFDNTIGQQAKVYVEGTGVVTGTVFNLDPPVGGNYWSDWEPGEEPPYPPYTFEGGQDDSPWLEPDGWVVDTIPPEITCPGNTTIEAMQPDGVPIDDERIQTFLDGASATDNVDPEEDIIITHDAPALFEAGDTTVTFTATDTSGNSSTCMSTVTVVEAAESQLKIIPRIINREGRLSKILAVMRFPAGTAEEDIDIGQNLILYPGDSTVGVEAASQRIITWYRDGTLRVSIFASFTKDDVTALIPEDGSVDMMVIGRFTDGQYFYGLDNVNIISWTWGWW